MKSGSVRKDRPPTSNAVEAIEKFFLDILELNTKNVVAAKIGSGRSLDVSKLSNLMGNAALTHANKTRARMQSAKQAFQLSVPMTLKLALRNVFIHYSNWPAESGLSIQMSRTQFLRCCRDCRLMGPDLTAVQLNILFEKVHQHNSIHTSGSRLSISDWIAALGLISNRLYEMLPQQAAFEAVVNEHVLRFAPEAGLSNKDDRLAAVMLSPEVVDYLHASEGLLFPIFEVYLKEQEFAGESNYKDVERAKSRLPFDVFLRFAHDFDITPKILGKSQLSDAFKCARFGHHEHLQYTPGSQLGAFGENQRVSLTGSLIFGGAEERMVEDAQRIGFDEFLDAMGRCALMAMNYQEPVEAVPTLSFSDSYQPTAKKLWISELEDSSSFDFPDEVLMPAADYYAPSPRGTMDDVISRAQSKVFSSKGSVKIVSLEEGGGGEVFQVHPEPEKLVVKNRPKHLSSFSPDWLGLPSGGARGEGILLSPLRSVGKGQKRTTLDSVASSLSPSVIARFQHAREGTIGAKMERYALFASETVAANERVEKERAHQKILDAAEHRIQTLERLQDHKAMRRDLQAYSGQRVVESEGGYQLSNRKAQTLTSELQSIF